MNTLRQAAEQALEALENHTAIKHPQQIHYRDAAIEALRAALAEPNTCTHGVTDGNCKECYMAEPVAWMNTEDWFCTVDSPVEGIDVISQWKPLYTAPPQRLPLTDEEIEQAYRHIWRRIPADFDHTSMGWIEQGIRYAEQAHGIGEKK